MSEISFRIPASWRVGVSFVAAFGLVAAGVAPAFASDAPVDQTPETPSVQDVSAGNVWDMPSQIPLVCVLTAPDATPDATADESPSESPSDVPATPETTTPPVESTGDVEIDSRTGSLPEPTSAEESPAPAQETSTETADPLPSASDPASAEPTSDPVESTSPSASKGSENEGAGAVVVCPEPVTGVAAEGGPNSASVRWTIGEAGAAPAGFYVEVTGPEGFAKTVAVPAPATGTEVAGLKNGIEYSIRVTAATRDGSAAASDWVTATPSTGMEGVVAGVIVEFEPGSKKAKGEQNVPGEDRVEGVDLTVGDKVAEDAVLVELSEPVDVDTATRIADDLEADPEVAWAEPDQFFFTSSDADGNVQGPGLAQPVSVPADSAYSSSQWNLWDTYGVSVGNGAESMTDAWAGATGDGVNVAVVDTGITPHPDLDGQLVPGYDFVSNPEKLAAVRQANAPPVAFDGDYVDETTYGALGRDANPSDPGDWRGVTPTRDSSWHGTQMAGIIAAANDTTGITGVAPNAKIQPVRALSWRGGLLSDIAAGITWAAGGTIDGVPANENPSKIINMSFAVETICPVALQDAIDGARERGSILIAAAGNASDDAAKFAPGNCNGVITVAASNRDGQRADYSNYGATIDLAAPGGDSASPIATASNTGIQTPDQPTTGGDFGTSAAAAHVSAAAAILASRKASLTPDQAYEQLTGKEFTKAFANATCDTANPDYSCGTGILSLAQIQTVASGDQDYAMQFNGTDQSGTAQTEVIPTSGAFTVSAWVIDDVEDDSTWRHILSQGNGGTAFYLGTDKDSQEIRAGDTWTSTGVDLPVGQWAHVALVADGSGGAVLYLNGQAAATKASGFDAPSGIGTDFQIGRQFSGSEYWKGQVDQVKVYDTNLSADAIAEDMQSWGMYAGGSVSSANHVALYDFNEGPAGTTGTGTIYNRVSGATSTTNLRTVNGPTYTNVKQIASNGNNTVITFPRSYLTAAGGWRMPEGASGVDYLVVAGGGGGGGEGNRGNWKGGGGAGGQVDSGSLSYSSIPVEVSVGLGGIGGPGDAYGNAGSGGSTTFGTATVTGGGRGGSATSSSAESGGIYTQTTFNPNGDLLGGGGGAQQYRQLGKSATAFSGGSGDGHPSNGSLQAGGGGAGAGANGTDGNAGTGGNGGNGVSSSITGTATTYGGGGGGGGGTAAGTGGTGGGGSGGRNSVGEAGSANSGGGGGGAGDGAAAAGGNGGSGVVIVSYSTVNTTCEPFESSYIDDGTVYRVLKWSDPAQTGCTWTVPTGISNFDYLIVGGGGAGGSADGATSSGGGGGGRVVEDSVTSPAASYSVAVGSGGEAQSVPSSGLPGSGGDGGTSSLGAFEALGGSGGASAATGTGRQGPASTSGWTGGGGSVWAGDAAAGSEGDGGGGYKGGDAHADGINSSPQAAGGGGGAGGPGADATSGVAGDGGVGVESTITGRTEFYGGGGGGGKRIADGSAGSGQDGGGDGGLGTAGAAGELGGGGGGAGVNNVAGVTNLGGAGGDGVVIVRYAIVENDTCEPFQYISGEYTVVEFQDAGSCTWTVPTRNSSVDVLVVGGGGGGGARIGGGGGGGGVTEETDVSVTGGGTYEITVGAGGSGGASFPAMNVGAAGSDGTGSSFGTLVTAEGGGGGGGSLGGQNAGSGATGGGGGFRTDPGMGDTGGAGTPDSDVFDNPPYVLVVAGGGGGAGGDAGAVDTSTRSAGAGGPGVESSISGSSIYYGGGGGGGMHTQNTPGVQTTPGPGGVGGGGAGAWISSSEGTGKGAPGLPGTDGLGGGGGGGSVTDTDPTTPLGGDGGDGVVIVRYLTDPPYELNYSANGGSGAPASSTWTYNSRVTISTVTPTLSGYAFTGWNTAANGSGTGYAPGGTFTMPASNVTLYAQWVFVPGTCSIVFNANGGSGSAPTVSAPCFTWVNADSGAGLSKADSTLSGWNTAANGTGLGYGLGAPLYLTGSNTLYAQWRSTADPDPEAGGGSTGEGDGSGEPSEPGEVLAPIAVTSGPDAPVLVDPLMSEAPDGDQWDVASVRLIDPKTGKLRKRLETKQGTWTVNAQTGEVAFLPSDGFVGTAQVEFRVRTESGQTYRSSMAVTIDPEMAPGLRRLSTSVYFAALSAELDSEARTKLRNLVRRVNERGTEVTATVVGYVQPVGGVANDFTLSAERAESTAAYLRRLGVEFITTTEGLGRADEPSARARRATATIWYSVD